MTDLCEVSLQRVNTQPLQGGAGYVARQLDELHHMPTLANKSSVLDDRAVIITSRVFLKC